MTDAIVNRPPSKWLIPGRPEAETICQVCGKPIIFEVVEGKRPPIVHNGQCRELWRYKKAEKVIEKFKEKQETKNGK